jgi:D-alanyl-D-alanine carboxypeptidase (penicillin-binding protein 5/6)
MRAWLGRARPAHMAAAAWPRTTRALVALLVGAWALAGCGTTPGDAIPLPGTGHERTRTMLQAAGPVLPAYTPTPLPSLAPPPAIAAPRMILVNPDTGGIYLEENANVSWAMASTTKLMTALVAVTHGHLDESITVGADSVALEGTGASVAGLRQGEVFTLQELLYALLLPSGDDAAVAIADGVAGSQAQFVALMNAEAQQLNLTHTHYADVHGLDMPGHYSSAADLAALAARVLQDHALATVVATPSYTLPASTRHRRYTFRNTNELLFAPVYPGVLGIKTGYTSQAGYCLVFAAAGPYGRLIGVVLGDPTEAGRFVDARALLDWGFALEARLHLLQRSNGLRFG